MKRYHIDLSDKLVAVTGAAGAICSSFSRELARAGAAVALIDINLEGAEKIAAEIRAEGGRARAYSANVLSRESLEECRKKIEAEMGKANMLINGAGGNHPMATTDKETYEPGDAAAEKVKSFFDLESGAIERLFALNFTSILLTTQVFSRDMAESGSGGSIINISSMNAFRPLTKIPAYSAAKAAVSNFTEWLAVHFAGAGIRVNAIAPGFFVGNQNRGLLFDKNGALTPRSEKIIAHTPMGRFGELDDLTGTLMWLADDEFSRFVTGVVVPVDGGFSAYSGV